MLTKEIIKGMTKKELIDQLIGDQNRLEYLQDKVQARDLELKKFKDGMKELQMAADVMLKQVAYLYGGKGKKIRLRPLPDLDAWEAEVDRNEQTKEMTVKLVKKE